MICNIVIGIVIIAVVWYIAYQLADDYDQEG